MSMTFTKLFSSITASTIWAARDQTRIVWITMLAMADQHGRVWASIPGLANIARVPIDACEAALEELKSPDKYSRTKDHDGRRIEDIDGGWRLLNHGKYRAIRDEESIKESKRRYINAKRAAERLSVENVEQCRTAVDRCRVNTEAEAEAEAEKEALKSLSLTAKAVAQPKSAAPSLSCGQLEKRPSKKCPADFTPTPAMLEWAAKEAPKANPEVALAKFRDFTFDRAIADWEGAWRNWMRKEHEFYAAKPQATEAASSGAIEATKAYLAECSSIKPDPERARAAVQEARKGIRRIA
jgi:hypothetical protein